jgi:hypothetical protein
MLGYPCERIIRKVAHGPALIEEGTS